MPYPLIATVSLLVFLVLWKRRGILSTWTNLTESATVTVRQGDEHVHD